MKKTLFTLFLISIAFLISNCRSFSNYTPDGQGGVYRKGVKSLFLYSDFNYVEHCKKDGAKLTCTEVDPNL